jgi:hypothetical protein
MVGDGPVCAKATDCVGQRDGGAQRRANLASLEWRQWYAALELEEVMAVWRRDRRDRDRGGEMLGEFGGPTVYSPGADIGFLSQELVDESEGEERHEDR